MNTKHRARYALTFIAALAVAGCGGGGGSSGGGTAAVAPANRVNDNIGTANTRMRAETAAVSTPQRGSVTQSSNAVAGVTQDRIAADAQYDTNGALTITIANQQPGSRESISTTDDTVFSERVVSEATGITYQRRGLEKTFTDGAAFVDVYTDRLSAADTDYLVGGVWVFVPNDATALNDFEIGAFVDGPDANLTPTAYLQTPATATYSGEASGLYLGADDGGEFGGEFGALVTLNAAFRASNPTIGGTVSDFLVRDISEDVYSSIDGNPTLTLGAATIDTTAAGGFFTGDTSGSYTDGGVTYRYTGKWGGEFYGNEAQDVVGTFGGNTANNPGDSSYRDTFIGAFAAQKE